MGDVVTLRALEDNLIYLWSFEQGRALAVDPGDAAVVLRELEARGLRLEAVLATHHHVDHVAGIRALKDRTGARVMGPDPARIPFVDEVVQDGQSLRFGPHSIQVIGTPGHTRTGVCYYVARSGGPGMLWTGDTLFQGGCGRILECDAETMWRSLQRLARLPDETLVYAGHDYALENYDFAMGVDPGNPDIHEAMAHARHGPRPSTLGWERRTNVFLLAGSDRVRSAVGAGAETSAAEVFARLRRRKDRF